MPLNNLTNYCNNTFKVIDQTVLIARSVDGLVFMGNKIENSQTFKPAGSKSVIDINSCKNILIEKNKFDLPEIPVVKISGTAKDEIRTDLKLSEQ